MELAEFTKDEKSLLGYFESRMVDHRGILDTRRMNDDDHIIAAKWRDAGFIQFGRIALKDCNAPEGITHWVFFSNEAWKLAAEQRRERAEKAQKSVVLERIGFVGDGR